MTNLDNDEETMEWTILIAKLIRYGPAVATLLYDLYSDKKDRESVSRQEFMEIIHDRKTLADERRKKHGQEIDDPN